MATIITTEDQSPRRRPMGLLKTLCALSVIALAFVATIVYWPQIAAHLPSGGMIIVTATPGIGTAPRATLPPYQPAPAAAPAQPAIDAYNATAQAQYQQATQPQTVPLPNVDNTHDSAPIEVYEKPVVREPAGDNVPTAEPIAQPAADDQTGEKIKPVNIQETHQCLHGQVWVDGKGCDNP